MAKCFFGFALADSMFSSFNGGEVMPRRSVLSTEQAKTLIEKGVEPCLNPSHVATIEAMKGRFNIQVAIPEKPPVVSLGAGDSLLVLSVTGLPRLTDRHEYTSEEVSKATFTFVLWTIDEFVYCPHCAQPI